MLRAFGKTVSERCRVMNGKEAVALLLGSVRVKQVRGVGGADVCRRCGGSGICVGSECDCVSVDV